MEGWREGGSGGELGGLVPGGVPAGDGAQGAWAELWLPEGSKEKQEVSTAVKQGLTELSTPHSPYHMYNTEYIYILYCI